MSPDTIAKNVFPIAASPDSPAPGGHNSEERFNIIRETVPESEVWLTAQKDAFQAAMNGAPLAATLDILIRTAIRLAGGETKCAFYLADADGAKLYHLTGMPESYASHIGGLKIGPESLACGLAIHRGHPLISPDIHDDPLWKPWLWLAEEYGYRGCWSFPVETSTGKHVGSFAMYFKEPRTPTARDLKRAALVTQTAAIIISRHQEAEERARAEREARTSEAQLRALVDATSDVVYRMSPDWTEMRYFEGKHFIVDRKAPVLDWLDQYVHPDDRAGVTATIQEAIRTKTTLESEHRVLRTDGTLGWILSRAIPLLDENGVIVEWLGAASDIDARKNAGDKLRASEERYRLASEAGNVGIYDYDPDAQVATISPQLCKIFGIPSCDRMDFATLVSLIHPDDREGIEQAIALAASGDGRLDTEYRILRPDGATRWVRDVRASFEDQATAKRTRIIGTIRDITERVRAEEELRLSNERLKRTLETEAVGVLFLQPDDTLIGANDAFLKMTGYSRAEVEDRELNWRMMTPPEWIKCSEEQAGKLAATGRLGPYEKEYFHKDGSRRWTLFAGRDLGDGTICEYCIDITERKQAEEALRKADERFRTMANAAPVLIWESDARGLLFVNRHYLDFFGVDFDALRNMRWVRFLHREDVADYLAAVRKSFERREPYTHECRLRRADGQYRWMLITGRPLGDDHLVGFCADITERKQAEQALRAADKQKDEFLALLGHELRNPLAAISTALQVLSGTTRLAERRELEKVAADQLALMRRLLDDLLDIGRISHGHIELKKEPIDLRDLLQGGAASAQGAVERRGQELHLKLPSKSVRFMADRTRLDQIIGNLLSNASMYTSPGGRIELSGNQEGPYVVFRCKDNGQGILPENLENIFEPFTRGRKTELGCGEANLGIGLAFARQLTRLHGGTIEAASPGVGMGSKFTVRLPLILPPAEDRIAEHPQPRSARAGRSILMVEDNPNLAKVMKAALEQAGHRVYLFADGAAALSADAGLTADAVLLDIGLPGMNGYELAAKLKQCKGLCGAKFIAISGFKPREQAENGDQEFDHYLIKPVDVSSLLGLLEAPEAAAESVEVKGGGCLRVLLVEDHPGVAVATASLLRREGLEVCTAATAREAIDAAPEFRPHLVLSDMNLPDMKGTELIGELKSKPPGNGIHGLVITARSASEIASYNINAAQMGVDGFLSKPIEGETIRTLIAQLRHGHARTRKGP